MTYSFGISPQREVRQATELPQQPAALPAPAQPAREPQRVGGQLLYARQFQPDTRTAETIKSVEDFVAKNGTYEQLTDLEFERYKKDKKEQALRLYQQETLAAQQSTAIALDTHALQKRNEFALARQNRLSNPWINFFYYDKKANVVADEVSISLTGWGDKNIDKLAELPDNGEVSAQITQKSQDLLKSYRDIPSAFVSGIIEPKVAAVQKQLKKKVHLQKIKFAEQRIISTGRTIFVGGISNVVKYMRQGLGDPTVMANSQGLLTKALVDTQDFLINQNGYSQRQANKIVLGYFDNMFIETDGDGQNDLGDYLTTEALVSAWSKVRTIDGGIPFTEIRDEETGESIATKLGSVITKAMTQEEKRLSAMAATARRAAKNWKGNETDVSGQWHIENPNATNAEKVAQAKAHLDEIRKTNEWRNIDLDWNGITEFINDLYKPGTRQLSSREQADLERQAAEYGRNGQAFPEDFLSAIEDTPIQPRLLTQNAKDISEYNSSQVVKVREDLARAIKAQITNRITTHSTLAGVSDLGAQGDEMVRLAKEAAGEAERMFDSDGITLLNDLVYQARTRGEDLTDPKVYNRILDEVDGYLASQRMYSDPTFYYNLTQKDRSKPFSARAVNYPEISSQTRDSNGAWKIQINSQDNLYSWSKFARPILSSNTDEARDLIKDSFIFTEDQLKEVTRAMITGKIDGVSKDTREVLANFRIATGNKLSASEIFKEQALKYVGNLNRDQNKRFTDNASSIDAQLTSYDAAPGKALEPADVTVVVNNWRHDHGLEKGKRNAVDVTFMRPGGQVGNIPIPSPVSGKVLFAGAVPGYGNTVVIEADRNGNGYQANDRILIAHGSKMYFTQEQIDQGKARVRVGTPVMNTGGVGTTTGTTTAPGVVHFQLFYPGQGFPMRADQKPQVSQNNFIRRALFPLIRRHQYPGQ